MKRLIIFFIIVLFAIPLSFASTELSLFGYNVGMSFRESLAIRPFDTYISGSNNKIIPGVSIGIVDKYKAGSIVISYSVSIMEGNVHAVNGKFHTSNFLRLVAALESKYGKGSKQESILQNKMGAKFKKETIEWQAGSAFLEITNTSNTTDTGTISLTSKKMLGKINKDAIKDQAEITDAI